MQTVRNQSVHMKLPRLLLAALAASAGLVVFTQVPAAACSCAGSDTAQYVKSADVVFHGTLTDRKQTNPGDDDVIGSGDPVFYSFDVEETFKGDAGDGVVESVRFGDSCGLEGMRVGVEYVVFATEDKSGALRANLCGGTARASERLIGEVETALSSTPPNVPAPIEPPQQPVPTQVPSGIESADSDGGAPTWMWFAGGVMLAVAGGALVMRW